MVLKQVLVAIALDLKVKRPKPVVPKCQALETTWGQLEEYGMVTLEPQVRQLEHLVEVASVLRPVHDCCFFVMPRCKLTSGLASKFCFNALPS